MLPEDSRRSKRTGHPRRVARAVSSERPRPADRARLCASACAGMCPLFVLVLVFVFVRV